MFASTQRFTFSHAARAAPLASKGAYFSSFIFRARLVRRRPRDDDATRRDDVEVEGDVTGGSARSRRRDG